MVLRRWVRSETQTLGFALTKYYCSKRQLSISLGRPIYLINSVDNSIVLCNNITDDFFADLNATAARLEFLVEPPLFVL